MQLRIIPVHKVGHKAEQNLLISSKIGKNAEILCPLVNPNALYRQNTQEAKLKMES